MILMGLQWIWSKACACVVLGSPALGTALQAQPNQCWAENNNHLIQPVANGFPNAAQKHFGCLCCKGALLAQVFPAGVICNWCSVWATNIRKTVSFSRWRLSKHGRSIFLIATLKCCAKFFHILINILNNKCLGLILYEVVTGQTKETLESGFCAFNGLTLLNLNLYLRAH